MEISWRQFKKELQWLPVVELELKYVTLNNYSLLPLYFIDLCRLICSFEGVQRPPAIIPIESEANILYCYQHFQWVCSYTTHTLTAPCKKKKNGSVRRPTSGPWTIYCEYKYTPGVSRSD